VQEQVADHENRTAGYGLLGEVFAKFDSNRTRSSPMIRILMVEDDIAEAELALSVLRSAGLTCQGDRVVSEEEFRRALLRSPDLILSDVSLKDFDGLKALKIARAERPSIPCVLRSSIVRDEPSQELLDLAVGGYVPKSDSEALVNAVRAALPVSMSIPRRASDTRLEAINAQSANDTATYLLERQASLERILHRDDDDLSGLFARTPPWPVALVMIQEATVRERYLKLLHHARIATEIANSMRHATVQLKTRTHAVLFTDALDLIREVRQLNCGAATHVVFVSPTGASAAASEALQAGANDTMPKEARGEQFWPRLSLARRIIGLASSLQSAVTHNRILATLDELTRCGNRRYFEQQFPREVARAIRLRRPLTLLMCDIDHFKVVNDLHGHQTGDEVLREIGDRLTHGLRLGEDWVARVGGEEFAIVLPDTGWFKALAVADRLRTRVNGSPIETSSGSLSITASFGVSAVQSPSVEMTELPDRMMTAADAALYRSKRDGRDRVTTAEGLEAITYGAE
jgi:diguanylate cyclase (GGDEF)-like protein